MIRSRLKLAVIFIFAFIGWALCAATMGLGMALTTVDNALIIHAIAAPILFFVVSFIYFRKFGYTTPIVTALIFVSFVIFMDFFVVALLIEKSFDMFKSIIGTWLPFALIFFSTYLTGKFVSK